MKKILLIMSLAVSAGFIGCSSDTTEDPGAMVPHGRHTFKAEISADKTRTALGEKGENSTPVLWSSGDAILVIDRATEQQYKYLLEQGSEDKESGVFRAMEGDGAKDAASVVSFYPYGNCTYTSADQITMVLPASQPHAAGRTFGTNLNPMYAISDAHDRLQFHHMAGVINLQLTSLGEEDKGRKVMKVELESSSKQLSGNFNVTEASDVYSLVGTDITNNNRISLDCGQGTELTQVPSCFLFVVPAGNYLAGDLRFTITIDGGAPEKSGNKVLTMTNPLTIALGQIVNFKATAMPNIVVVESAPKDVEKNIEEALNNIETTNDTPTLVVNVTPSTEGSTADVTLPKFDTEEKQNVPVTIQMAEAPSVPMTIKTDADQAPKQVSIVVPTSSTTESAPEVSIDMPKSTVSLNGTFKIITATTADNTLIIEKGANIGILTVNKGSVEIYGLVGTIAKGQDAGSISRYISSTEGLEQATQADDMADLLYLDGTTDFIDGKGATLTKSLTVIGNAKFKNLNLNPTKGWGKNPNYILTIGDDAKCKATEVSIQNVKIYLTAVMNRGLVIGDYAQSLKVNVKDSYIALPTATNIRPINIYNDAYPDQYTCELNLDNVHIGPTETPVGDRALTTEEDTAFKKRSDSRGINVSCANVTVNLCNSVIEGAFYAFNIPGVGSQLTANIDNTILDGRNAFNIWGKHDDINVSNSTLIGRNSFSGSTEDFATIVCNADVSNQSQATITVTDSKIISYNAPQTATNHQFSADLRSTDCTLNLRGATKLIEKETPEYPARLNYMVVAAPLNTVNVDPTVTVEGKPGACVLPERTWDGTSVIEPMKTSLTFEGKTIQAYMIAQPSELAWFSLQINSGAIAGSTSLELQCDIDLGGKEWTPIGFSGKSFSGYCFGEGYTVSNFRVTGTGALDDNAKGLFGYTAGARFYDITVTNAEVAGSERVAALVAVTYGSTFSGCHVANCRLTGSTSVGGIVGQWSEINKGFAMTDCSVNNLQITILNNEGFSDAADKTGKKIGGLIGAAALYYTGCTLTLTDCTVSGLNIISQSGVSVAVNDILGQLDNTVAAPNPATMEFKNVIVTNGTGYRTTEPFFKYIGAIRNLGNPYVIRENGTQILPALP